MHASGKSGYLYPHLAVETAAELRDFLCGVWTLGLGEPLPAPPVVARRGARGRDLRARGEERLQPGSILPNGTLK